MHSRAWGANTNGGVGIARGQGLRAPTHARARTLPARHVRMIICDHWRLCARPLRRRARAGAAGRGEALCGRGFCGGSWMDGVGTGERARAAAKQSAQDTCMMTRCLTGHAAWAPMASAAMMRARSMLVVGRSALDRRMPVPALNFWSFQFNGSKGLLYYCLLRAETEAKLLKETLASPRARSAAHACTVNLAS